MSDDAKMPVPEGDPALDEARQLALELGETAEWDRFNADARATGVYTGERFKQLQPAKYNVACQLLAAGLGVLKIAAILRVSHHTIAAVRDGAGRDQVAREKTHLSNQMRLVVRLLLERSLDEIHSIPIEEVPRFVGVLTDKMQLLDGQATQRIETGPSGGPTIDSFRAYVAGLAAAEPVQTQPAGADGALDLVDHPEPTEPDSQNGGADAPRE